MESLQLAFSRFVEHPLWAETASPQELEPLKDLMRLAQALAITELPTTALRHARALLLGDTLFRVHLLTALSSVRGKGSSTGAARSEVGTIALASLSAFASTSQPQENDVGTSEAFLSSLVKALHEAVLDTPPPSIKGYLAFP